MNILVTGGAGFIGSHLIERLLYLGHHVTAVDDFSNGKKEYLPSTNVEHFTFVEGDILDRYLLEDLVEECDLIYHLAAVLGVKNTVENPLKVIDGCILGTRNILEVAYQKGIKVVFASTSEIYGKNTKLPFTEDSDRVLGPPQTTRWCYATAKSLDEHLCFAYSALGLPITIVRFFNTYGPRQTSSQYGGVVPKFIVAALRNEDLTVYGDGTQTRCFTFIHDTIHALVNCIDKKANDEVINIGSNEKISIASLAVKIKELADSSSDIVEIPYDIAYGKGFEDMQDREPSLEKAKRLLDYVPSIRMEEGLKETIRWYREQLDP
ncbi:NAD-dependent epimerase/dehydratase family protein [Priestia koreensis]|uniref:NAD-dependent epimerase/dehydratase family protein n=1 Tax=Priestia koreensis TaxID=284581 RepID=UPI0020422FCD|nr:NAD-dependent epimerase/dehydratase family protein [Priestia koreensis]MCM3005473.1 GDP-mannose 4,6-dehydratase [Priestia koreensis]